MPIEYKSIDYIAENERHGRVADQITFWFLGNFHFFTIAIGFVGPSMGLGLGATALAGALGILFALVELLQKKQVGKLFDGVQRIGEAAGLELVPERFDFRAELGGSEHGFVRIWSGITFVF